MKANSNNYNLTRFAAISFATLSLWWIFSYFKNESFYSMLFDNSFFCSAEVVQALGFLARIKKAMKVFEKDLLEVESRVIKLASDQQLSSSLGQHFRLKVGELSSELDFLLSSLDKINLGGKSGISRERVRQERKKVANLCADFASRVDGLMQLFS